MKVWVVRDKDLGNSKISIWIKKPNKHGDNEGCFYFSSGKDAVHYIEILPEIFKKFFGYIPRKGSCEEKELILK